MPRHADFHYHDMRAFTDDHDFSFLLFFHFDGRHRSPPRKIFASILRRTRTATAKKEADCFHQAPSAPQRPAW